MDTKANLLKVYPNSKIDPKQYKVEADSVSDEKIKIENQDGTGVII
jgi:hypothetical protein